LPSGQVVFHPAGLARPRSGRHEDPTVWAGKLQYGSNRSVTVTVRLRIRERVRAVIASKTIPAGSAVEADALEIREIVRFPEANEPVGDAMAVTGLRTVRAIRAGEPVRAGWLTPSALVHPGDSVDVVVVRGSARVRVSGRSESSMLPGKKGVVQLADGRRVTGRAVAKGLVINALPDDGAGPVSGR
jgi:flagella basal body P-ring formation protein FlgA